MRATRDASGWKIDEPRPIKAAERRTNSNVLAKENSTRPTRVTIIAATSENGWG